MSEQMTLISNYIFINTFNLQQPDKKQMLYAM